MLYKNHIFQCMGMIFCVEFQREPLKFHTKYLTHTFKDVDFIHRWKFKSAYIWELIGVFEMPPRACIDSFTVSNKSMVWCKIDETLMRNVTCQISLRHGPIYKWCMSWSSDLFVHPWECYFRVYQIIHAKITLQRLRKQLWQCIHYIISYTMY